MKTAATQSACHPAKMGRPVCFNEKQIGADHFGEAEFPQPALLGTYRSFGPVGPAYQIINPIRQLDDGDWLLSVQVLETGEEVQYRYTQALEDPKAI